MGSLSSPTMTISVQSSTVADATTRQPALGGWAPRHSETFGPAPVTIEVVARAVFGVAFFVAASSDAKQPVQEPNGQSRTDQARAALQRVGGSKGHGDHTGEHHHAR